MGSIDIVQTWSTSQWQGADQELAVDAPRSNLDYDDAGRIRFAPTFQPTDRSALSLHDGMVIAGPTDKHRAKLT